MKKSIYALSIIIFLIIVILPSAYMVFDALRLLPAFEKVKELFFNPRTFKLFLNSLLIGLGSSAIAIILGVPLGFFIARTDIYLRKVFGYLYLLPLLIPSYIAAISWIGLLGVNGRINVFFMKLLGLNQALFSVYGLFGVILVLGLSYFPFVSLLTISGLRSVDRRLEEAALLSAGYWQVFRKITLPLIMPFVVAGGLFVFIFSISNYGVPALLRVNVYPLEIFSQFSAFYNPQAATLVSFPLVLIALALVLISYFYMKGKSYVSLEGVSRSAQIIGLGAWRFMAFSFVGLVIFLAAILPIIVLIIESASLISYKVALKSSLRPILTSLILAFTGASVCVILSFFLAYLIERSKSRFKIALDMLTIIPLAVPATVLGIGLIMVWNNPQTAFIYSSFLIIILGFVARFIPFSVRSISSNLRQINQNMEEAAVLAGAGFIKRIIKIDLPLLRPGLLAGWIITFVFCMGELSTTLLIIPAGSETLASKIFTLMHYGVGKLTSALCVILIFVTVVPVALLGFLFRKRPIYDQA